MAATQNMEALYICRPIVGLWNLRNPVVRLMRRFFVSLPTEFDRWHNADGVAAPCAETVGDA